MTLEQRLFLHRQIARLLEPVPPDVRLKILADFEAEIKGQRGCNCGQLDCDTPVAIPPGTTTVSEEARQMLRHAANDPRPGPFPMTTDPFKEPL